MVGETSLGPEEGKSSGCVELDQPGEEQATEQHAQHPQEEGRTGRYRLPPVGGFQAWQAVALNADRYAARHSGLA